VVPLVESAARSSKQTIMIEQGQILARIADLKGRVQSLRGYL
jgi:hypothetical protein